MRAYNFFVSGLKFTVYSLNVGGVVVYQLFFRFWISPSVSETLAIEV